MKYDSLIIALQKPHLTAAGRIFNDLTGRGKNPLLITGENISAGDIGFPGKNIQEYQDIFKLRYFEIKDEAYELSCKLAEGRISDTLLLREATVYKGVPLWDTSVTCLFEELIPAIYYLKLIPALLDYEKPNELHIVGEPHPVGLIFSMACEQKRIKCIRHRHEDTHGLLKDNKIIKVINLIRKLKRLGISLCFFLKNSVKSGRLKNKYRIIFFSPLKRLFDSMLPVVLKYKFDERLVINTYMSNPSGKFKENNIDYLDAYGFSLYNPFSFKIGKTIKKIKYLLFSKDNFCRKVSYNKFPLWPILEHLFNRLLDEEFPEKIRNIDIFRKILLRYKPSIAVVANPCFEAIFTSKSLNITVLAIQSTHIIDLTFFGNLPIDEFTVVGNYWKEFLVRHNYEPSRISVTGPTKFDNLSGIFDGTEILRQNLGVAAAEKLIVYACTYSGLSMGISEYEHFQEIKKVCGAIKKIAGVHLVIKMHPYENNFAAYQNVIIESGIMKYTVIRDMGMSQLICACDLLMTHFSTVAYDAVLLDKNVMYLSGSSKFHPEDLFDFKSTGAAIMVEDLAELENSIRAVFYDPVTISNLNSGREKYALEHAYIFDGLASNRVKDVIDRVAQNKSYGV